MAKQPESYDTKIARQMLRDNEQLSKILSELRTPGADMEKLSPAEELRRWNWTPPGFDPQALYAQGASLADVTLQMYPLRPKLAAAGGRLRYADQQAYCDRMAARSARTTQPTPDAAMAEDSITADDEYGPVTES